MGSESTVGSSVLYQTESAKCYLMKGEGADQEDAQLSQSTVSYGEAEPAALDVVPMPEDILVKSPPQSLSYEVPNQVEDLSGQEVRYEELQVFEGGLSSG